jgi:hypothetical protein
MTKKMRMPKKAGKGGDHAKSPKSVSRSIPDTTPPCRDDDFFCKAAIEIDVLSCTELATARVRWKALKESAETDGSGGNPPDLLDAGAIAAASNHPVAALVKLNILLSVRNSFDYVHARQELNAALPPSRSTYERTFLKRFRKRLGRDPYNFGSDERKRYAVTYAELLHMREAPGIELVEELDGALRNRLETL